MRLLFLGCWRGALVCMFFFDSLVHMRKHRLCTKLCMRQKQQRSRQFFLFLFGGGLVWHIHTVVWIRTCSGGGKGESFRYGE